MASPKDVLFRSPDFWYTDGSVVLQAGTTLFRVHMGILSEHSGFFKDLFSLPQPTTPDPELYEGCPLIAVHDNPDDWRHYLKAIYRWSYFRPGRSAKFEVVAAIARLSTKYDSPYLRQRVIDHLMSTFPADLAGWARRDKLRLIPPLEGGFGPTLNAYLPLATSCNIRILIPPLYWVCSQYPLAEMIPNLQSLALNESEKWDICTTFLVGREKLREAEATHILAFLKWDFSFTNSCYPRCGNKEQMHKARSRAIEDVAGPETFARWCLGHASEAGSSLGFCRECSKSIEEAIQEGYAKVWEKLPEYFGFPGWETLKAEASVFDESSLEE
ncbi:hypothetical protein JAAARDRAFT_206311 [Jaapia argillacea MUCL 33604]|uniref:BTB domain-containing protein n=1 Tax=Jaapia argillacea MUCL 33604 TaxID=933084 RepID=A0A067Q4F3_9AGAM|nr:hypothetical protein JAAARDRAFT_206311 [Jaapia argillacea MUCL 33604]